MPEISENLSPIKQAFRRIRFSGLIRRKEDRWALPLVVYHTIMLGYVGTGIVLELCLEEHNLTDFVQALSTMILFINDSTKATNILINQKEIKDLFGRLDKFTLKITKDDIKTYQDEEETQSKSFRVKFISVFIVTLLWLSPLSFITGFIGDYLTDFVKPHLPYQVWLPWSMKDFWPYTAGMIFVTMIELSSCIFYVSYTIILLTFTNEFSACVKVLQIRLETNGPSDKNVFDYHKAIIQLLQDFNKLFSGPLYIETVISTVQPCGFGYAFIKTFHKFDPAAIELICKALLCVAAPYIVCSCGQAMSDQMEQLHISAYLCKWYEETPKTRKDLLTLLTVTTKRNDCNYRRFVSFNYVCFAAVMQGIYSYLMMIMNFETE